MTLTATDRPLPPLAPRAWLRYDVVSRIMVCAFEVLEHIEDDKEALAERVTDVRPGGQLVLSVPAFQERFEPMDRHAGHFRRYSPEELTRATGRTFQPSGQLKGAAIALATSPFMALQRLRPDTGTGLVAVATKRD